MFIFPNALNNAKSNPIVSNAPGASMNIVAGLNELPNDIKFVPNKINLPVPRSSLIMLINAIARKNPTLIPKASKIDLPTLCFEEKLSALPNIIQLTTINGTNIPSDLLNAG